MGRDLGVCGVLITFEDVASHAAGMRGQPVGVRGFEIVPDRGAGREYIPATVIGVIGCERLLWPQRNAWVLEVVATPDPEGCCIDQAAADL